MSTSPFQPHDRPDTSWLPGAHARRAFLPENPEEHARRICDVVLAVWPTTGAPQIPLGVLATVALLPCADSEAPGLGPVVAGLPDAGFVAVLRAVWSHLWTREPYLVERAHLLYRWMASIDEAGARQVTELGHLLLHDGVVEHGAQEDRYLATDLLGRALQQLTTRGDKARRGAFHTPAKVADHMSEYLVADVEAPAIIGESAAGSGTMWRAVARRLRQDGKDPATFQWVGAEIDPLAAAVLAANSLLWRLGSQVVIANATR